MAVAKRASPDGQTLLAGFASGLLDGVALLELGKAATKFAFDIASPQVSGEGVGTVRFLIDRHVIGASKADDMVDVGGVPCVAAGLGVIVQSQVQLCAGVTMCLEVADLGVDSC